MLLYAITNRALLPGSERDRHAALAALAHGWAQAGVNYVQIREKDLDAPELLVLSREIVAAVRSAKTQTRVLLNGPAEIAINAGADGVHLPSDPGMDAARVARERFARAGRRITLSYSCHTLEEVQAARAGNEADGVILFAPVFGKVVRGGAIQGCGLDVLRRAVEAARPVPVIALGGVTPENAQNCVDVGVVGVAGIRLFLDDGWRTLL